MSAVAGPVVRCVHTQRSMRTNRKATPEHSALQHTCVEARGAPSSPKICCPHAAHASGKTGSYMSCVKKPGI